LHYAEERYERDVALVLPCLVQIDSKASPIGYLTEAKMTETLDIVIKNARVMDGTGNPWLSRDIGIAEGKIKRIGPIAEKGKKTIDARGLTLTPGFVDLHNHSDLSILPHPDAESFIMQGVTTAAVGHCGLTMAPVNPTKLDLLRRYVSPFLIPGFDYGWNWHTLREYFERVKSQGISLNFAPLVGQGTIRLAVKGFDPSEVTKEEMRAMQKLLEQSLEEGAFGMSTGLIYPPGSYSSTQELIELASLLKKYGALYATHLRDESDNLIRSLDEAILIGEENEIPVEIVHHKAAGRANWGKVNATLRIMTDARARGLEINCDVYPYTAGSTTITALLPTYMLEGGVESMLERLQDKKTREALNKDITKGTMKEQNQISACGWNNIFIGACPSHKEYEGRSLEDILTSKKKLSDPCEGLFDWLLETKGNATMIVFQMHEDDVRTVISSPLSSVASDGWATSPSAGGKPHPRAYGTFPRVLGKYVREEKLLSLEDAVRKMTSLPAGKLGLTDRGILREGFWADIVVFDPETITDKATYANPHQYPEGIYYVLVNGQVAVQNGKLTGARPGRVLQRR